MIYNICGQNALDFGLRADLDLDEDIIVNEPEGTKHSSEDALILAEYYGEPGKKMFALMLLRWREDGRAERKSILYPNHVVL
jgi:hypothetical protein